MTRIVLVDDHNLVRSGIKAMLTGLPDLTVVAEAGTAREGLAAVQGTRCDLAVVDYNLPDEDGPWLVTQIRRNKPRLPILLLSQHTEPDRVRLAMDSGAHGYMVKSAAEEEFLVALRVVASGGVYVHPAVARLWSNGVQMGENDMWIASTALVGGLVVVTRDADFGGCPGLTAEDW